LADTDFDSVRPAGPQFGYTFRDEPTVTLILPAGLVSSHVVLRSGETRIVNVDTAGLRVIDVSASDARLMLNGGTSDSLKWFHANEALAQRLGPPKGQ